jgi:Holliday junction resolvase RusA-like endonuclease
MVHRETNRRDYKRGEHQVKSKGILPLPTYTKGRGDKKKTNLLSLNVFRNLHYQAKNKVKQDYADLVREFVKTLPKYKTIQPSYTLYFNNNRKKDLDNYTFPMHKFLMDTLVEEGVIEDDHYGFVNEINTEFGGINDDNFVVVEIKGEEYVTKQKQ